MNKCESGLSICHESVFSNCPELFVVPFCPGYVSIIILFHIKQ